MLGAVTRHPEQVTGGAVLNRWNVPALVYQGVSSQLMYESVRSTIETLHTALFGTGRDRALARWQAGAWAMTFGADLPSDDWWVGSAVTCLDVPQRPTVDEVLPIVNQQVGAYARLKALSSVGTCAGYTFAPDPVPTVTAGAGPAVPVMVTGSTRDGRTPGAWLRRMAAAFPASATVAYRGGQRVVWTSLGSDCIDAPLTRYVVSGRQPLAGRTCPNNYAIGGLVG